MVGYKGDGIRRYKSFYGYTLKTLMKGFGPHKLTSIKALDIENFLKGLQADGKSNSSLTKFRGMLYQIMADHFQHEVYANPGMTTAAATVHKPQRPVGKQKARKISMALFTAKDKKAKELRKGVEAKPRQRRDLTNRYGGFVLMRKECWNFDH